MTSVRQPEWQRFARAKFIEEMSNEDAYRESGRSLDVLRKVELDSESFLRLVQSLLPTAAALVEQRGWLEIGASIGYFHTAPPLDEADRRIIFAASESSEGLWHPWFRRFARSAAGGDISAYVPETLRSASTAALGIFQAAFILAAEFRDPLLVALQRALHDGTSVLDKPVEPVSAAAVFEAMETSVDMSWQELRSQQKSPRLVAGFLQLAGLLAAFDALFPFDNIISDSPRPATARDAISKMMANLLMWRLNLWSEVVVRRLEVISAAFWELCGREFARYPELSFRWAPQEARAELDRLLHAWRERSDVDPGSPRPDLSGIAGRKRRTPAPNREFSFEDEDANAES
ncbi:MAG TPA: hypothetical protein VF283_03810 [Bryobacteraceae bacterium]